MGAGNAKRRRDIKTREQRAAFETSCWISYVVRAYSMQARNARKLHASLIFRNWLGTHVHLFHGLTMFATFVSLRRTYSILLINWTHSPNSFVNFKASSSCKLTLCSHVYSKRWISDLEKFFATRTNTTQPAVAWKTFSHSLKRPAILVAEKVTVNPLVWSVKSHRAGCQIDTVR